MSDEIRSNHMASEHWRKLPDNVIDPVPIDFDNYYFTNFLRASPFDANYLAQTDVMHPPTYTGPSSPMLACHPKPLPDHLLEQTNSMIVKARIGEGGGNLPFALNSVAQDSEVMTKWTHKVVLHDVEVLRDVKYHVGALYWQGKFVFVRYIEFEDQVADEDRFYIIKNRSCSGGKSTWSMCYLDKNHMNIEVDELGFEKYGSICRSKGQEHIADGNETDASYRDSSISRAKRRRNDVNDNDEGASYRSGIEMENSEDPLLNRGERLPSSRIRRPNTTPHAKSTLNTRANASSIPTTPGLTVDERNDDLSSVGAGSQVTSENVPKIGHMNQSDRQTPQSIHGLDINQGIQLGDTYRISETAKGPNGNGMLDGDILRKILIHCKTWNGVPPNRRPRSARTCNTAEQLRQHANCGGVFPKHKIGAANQTIWVDFRNGPENSNPWTFEWRANEDDEDVEIREKEYQDFLSMAMEHCRGLVATDASLLCEFEVSGQAD